MQNKKTVSDKVEEVVRSASIRQERPRADFGEEIGRRIAASPKQTFMKAAASSAIKGPKCGQRVNSLQLRQGPVWLMCGKGTNS